MSERVPRVALRAAAVLCLLLAALVLGADHAEYRQLTRAGLRALGRGALPLLAIGALNLRAVEGTRGHFPWRVAALVADVVLLGYAARMAARGGPPLAWMLLVVAAFMLGALVALIRRAGPSRGTDAA